MSHRSARRTLLSVALLPLLMAAACGAPPPAEPEPASTDAIAYEGARIIVGDGTVLDSGTLLVEQDRLLAVGPSNAVTVPDGAERVDLSGRTVMPAIIDTHVHLREDEREPLIEDLQRKAYYGVGAVLSLGPRAVLQGLRETPTLLLMHWAFATGLMQFGVFRIKKD